MAVAIALPALTQQTTAQIEEKVYFCPVDDGGLSESHPALSQLPGWSNSLS
jgi:hypothetical protein